MEGVLHGYSLKVKRFCRQRSANAFGQGTPHGGTGLEGSQHDHRFDGSACQLRSDVVRDAREPDHLNLQALTGSHRAFKILSSYVLQAHGESALRHRLLHDIGVQGQLIAHGRADKIRAVCVEAFLHQQVDVTNIYHAHFPVIFSVSPPYCFSSERGNSRS
jgi:hypothetical protein